MDIEAIKQTAKKELQEEAFREAVEAYKRKLKTKRTVWDIFPYRIIIIKKEKQRG